MGDAYTPGLTVVASTRVYKERRLPLKGDVLVSVGDTLSASDVVARTLLPGPVNLINMSRRLGVLPEEINATLRCEIGSVISTGDVLAEKKTLFGLFSSNVISPIEGTLESVSSITGQAVLREMPVPVNVTAYIDGTVSEVIPDEGVVMESNAALIQGIFGIAGEVHAPLSMVCAQPDMLLDRSHIVDACAGKIIIGGARVTLEAIRRAIEIGVAGIVTGGVAYEDIKELLGYDIGVAVTGDESIGVTLMVTEGFGDIAMANSTFTLLKKHEGDMASMNGATQIRAGVIRPEVVIPFSQQSDISETEKKQVGLQEGVEVRCIRAPYFGNIGKVISLPIKLQTMPSETKVRVIEVQFDNGERVVVPRANVEVIEQ